MPSRVRYQIVFLALVIDMISYMDRVCISVAAPAMRTEFGFSPTRMGAVFSIFSLSYFLLQAPWGMLADRYGARGIVATAILLWSGFTALTSMAWNYASLLVTRLLFGASEAALSPSIASAYGRWIPVSERSTAFGAFLSGGRIGGAMAPPVAAWILARHGWRAMFLAFAGLGAAWSVVWWAYYRNHPREHPGVTEAELKVIEAGGRSGQVQEERTSLADQGGSPETTTPWRVLLASRPLVLLLAVAFGYTFMWQFYITWFPTYLVERRGMDLREASRYASLPFAFGLAANWVGGVIADLLTRRYGARFGRGSLGFGALMLSASLLLVGIWYPGARAAALLIALAAGAGDMFLGAAWASAVAIGGKAAGAVSGLMNSASNFGGFVSPVLMGWAYERWQDWNTVLAIGVLANAISAFLWLGVNAGKERAGAGGSAARS